MRYLLALDQGTTSSRAIVFDSDLAVRGVAQKEFKQIFPRDGWVEHDPQEIWQSQREVAIEAIANARIPPAEIAGLGITNQRETTLVWDRASGEPIHNAIVWQDRRTADQCEALRRRGKEEFIQTTTGLMLDPYFSASKIAWLLDHCEGARAAAVEGRLAFGTVDSWLVWKLTGGKRHLTDHSNASRTMLYNIGTGAWDDELLELWNIPRALLPDIVDSGGVCGETTELTDDAIPIAGIAGDQHAALFGQACFEPGSAKCTYGTGCFILLNTGPAIVRSTTRLLTTVAWSIEGAREFALEGSVFMGGAAVQWLRDGLGIIADASAVEMLANQVADSGGVVMVPAFTGLGAPHWDPDARGAIFGLTRGSTAAHIARATLEGIAFQVADVIDAMREDAGQVLVELKVDGGATANDTLMQFQADLLATQLMRPQNPESTALGAAALAGLGVGLFAGREAISRLWRAGKSFSPRSDGEALQPARQRWRVALERSKNWATEAGGG